MLTAIGLIFLLHSDELLKLLIQCSFVGSLKFRRTALSQRLPSTAALASVRGVQPVRVGQVVTTTACEGGFLEILHDLLDDCVAFLAHLRVV